MDQIWARDRVLTEMKRRRLAGDPPIGKLELQPLVGMGHGDVEYALTILAEEGKVSKIEEGAVAVYELQEDEPGAGEAPSAADAPEVAGEAPSSPWAGAAAAEPVRDMGREIETLMRSIAPRTMSMSAAAAQALHPDALGALIMAGLLEASDAGVSFTFTVEP